MINLKQLSTISLAMLTAGALFTPVLSVAAPTATTATHAAVTTAAPAEDAQKEAGPLQKALDKLNLTQDQRTKINTLISDAQPELAKLRADKQASKHKIRDLTFTDKFDADQVDVAAKQHADVVVKIIDARAKLQNNIYNVLTTEQKQQFQTWMKERESAKTTKHAMH